MDALENISLYQNLIYISIAIAVIGLGLSIFFFFYFDIPSVYRLKTGRGKKEKVQKISEENFNTSKIRFNGQSGSTKKGHTGSTAPVQTQPMPQADETALLGGQAGETSVLGSAVGETSVLQTDAGETSVLTQPELATTEVLHKQDRPVVDPAAAAAAIHFQVVEQTMLIHTDEQVN